MEENRKAHSPRQLAGRENIAPVWSQSSKQKELRVVRKRLMIKRRGTLLRNGEYVQGESATKGYVLNINLSQAFKQRGRNTNVRKRERETAISVVLVIVGRLKLKEAVCVPGGPVLTTISTIYSEKLRVTVDLKSHITAAVSCCLEMAL